MCGIAGLVAGMGAASIEDALARMTATLAHRGPEGQGVDVFEAGRMRVGLAHRGSRSSTCRRPAPSRWPTRTAPSGSPSTARSTTSPSCGAELEARGHRFRSRTRHRGDRPRLRGVGRRGASSASTACSPSASGTRGAGGCCWRATAPARSRCSTRSDAGRLRCFASEIKALLAAGRAAREIDPPAPGRLPGLRLRAAARHHVPRASASCRPAHRSCVDERRRASRSRRYWRPAVRRQARDAAGERRGGRTRPPAADRGGAASGWWPTCRWARSSRAASTRPSSSALMAAAAARPVRTFSIGFAGDPRYDETRATRAWRPARFGTDHTEFVVDADAVRAWSRSWSGTTTARSATRRPSPPTWSRG